MSHSTGFLSYCDGRWVRNGKPHEGVQQQKCSKCSRLRNTKVRPCLGPHSWEKKGGADFGKQKQACSRCGQDRVTQNRACFLSHTWKKDRKSGEVRCRQCGAPKSRPTVAARGSRKAAGLALRPVFRLAFRGIGAATRGLTAARDDLPL
jgi:hypothetical protein